MSARSVIVDQLVEALKNIDGSTNYRSNLFSNVSKTLVFWDELNDFPYICVTAGTETRDYLPSNFKWGLLSVSLKIYVKQDDSMAALEDLLVDIEYVVDNNQNLTIDSQRKTTEVLIMSIVTDEGVLAPYGVGEVNLLVRYPLGSIYN